MTAYIVRRILSLVPVLFGISLLAFILGYLAPGDPAGSIFYARYVNIPATAEALEEIREEFGLNDPFLIRYVRWMTDVLQGDLGKSYRTDRSVLEEFTLKLPNTLRLAVFGLIIGVGLAFPLGILAAVYHNSVADVMTRIFSMLDAAMPSF